MLKKIKKRVKRVMKEVKTVIDDSFTKEVYDDIKKLLSNEADVRKLAVIIAGSAFGLAASLFASTYVR